MKRPIFGRAKRSPAYESSDFAERQKQKDLWNIAEELYIVVAGQIESLPNLKADYADRWPEALPIGKMQTGLKDVREALDVYTMMFSKLQKALPPESTNSLTEIVGTLENTRVKISENVASFVADRAMRQAMKAAGLNAQNQ